MSGAIEDFVGEMNAGLAKDCLVIGQTYRHPKSRNLLRVTSGSFLGDYGRISNFWYWRYLDEDHVPTGKSDHGYGWAAKPVEGKG